MPRPRGSVTVGAVSGTSCRRRAFNDASTFVTQTGSTLLTLPNATNAASLTIPSQLTITQSAPGGFYSGSALRPISVSTRIQFHPVKSGNESFDVLSLIASTYAFGLTFYEPTSSVPVNGCNVTPCTDSTLSSSSIREPRYWVRTRSLLPITPSISTVTRASNPITTVTIRETVGSNDNEFFGRFYTGATSVPLPAATWLLLAGLAGLGLTGRRRTVAR